MGLRERKKAATREALIDAAARLFAARGVEATTMDDIAVEASMSRTSVFNYFGYKEALLVEIGARYVRQIGEAVHIERRRPSRQLLYDLADTIARLGERDPVLIPAVAREMTHPSAERRHYAAQRMGYPMLYEGILRELATSGRLRNGRRLSSYARQLLDITSGTLVRAGGDFPREKLREELRANVDLFWDGAVRPEPGEQ